MSFAKRKAISESGGPASKKIKRSVVCVYPKKKEEPDAGDQILPNEMLVFIAERGRWKSAAGVAACSKALLKAFCSEPALSSMVDFLLSKPFPRTLPRWLTISLPRSWISDASVRNVVSSSDEDERLLDFLRSEEGRLYSFPHFLTGGYACRALYAKNGTVPAAEEEAWKETDLDVWVPSKEIGSRTRVGDRFFPTLGSKRTIDVVPTRARGYFPHECVERFDLSIVQQGLYLDTGEEYCTPLSLYTARSRNIVINVADYSIDYETGNPEQYGKPGGSRCLLADIIRHYTQHIPGAAKYAKGEWTLPRTYPYGSGHFFECPACVEMHALKREHLLPNAALFYMDDTAPSHQMCGYFEKVYRWMLRLEKYHRRFPGFRMTFVVDKCMLEDRPKAFYDVFEGNVR
jgi:hypothetical protein